MSDTTVPRAATPWHPKDCTCGLCRPAPITAALTKSWRPSRTLTAIVVALVLTTVVSAFVGYRLAWPAGLHCIRSHGTSACYTEQTGPGTVVPNTTDLNVYGNPAWRAKIECYLEAHGVTLPGQQRCRKPAAAR
jgi:hypothetical protein